MFALLLIVPVAVFATEKLTNSADGGGKEKHKSEGKGANAATTTTVGEAATGTSAETAIATEHTIATETEKTTGTAAVTGVTTASKETGLTESESIEEVKAVAERLMDSESAYYSNYENLKSLYEDDIDKNLRKWLIAATMDNAESINPMSMNLANSYSRCPTGYHVVLVTRDEKLTHEGYLVADRGCRDQAIAHFRYDYNAKTVLANAGKKLGYVALEDYLHLLKAANV
jgi:hypothetical protein